MEDVLLHQINEYFPDVHTRPIITDEFILENQDLQMIDFEGLEFKYIPSYMIWCLKNESSELVDWNLLNVLAEYGRAQLTSPSSIQFKYKCNKEQHEVVYKFLCWCRDSLYTLDEKQLSRALRNWGTNGS
jgi:hypothetical protein